MRDVLTVCKEGVTITELMFQAYITHGQAKAYTKSLIENGHLAHNSKQKKYHTTQEGLTYLNALEQMSELLPAVGRRAQERMMN